MPERVFVGNADVDAGIIWIGDPCYVVGGDSSHGPKDWDEFCDKWWKSDGERAAAAEPLGEGVGVCVGRFGGDGSYPVYVTIGSDGLVTKAEIFFYYSVDADKEIFPDDEDRYYDDEEDEDYED